MRILKINPMVVKELQMIRDYIAEDNVEVAKKVLDEIYSNFEYIQRFPEIGSKLSKRVSFKTNYRYFIQGNYITIYLIEHEIVEIYRIFDRFQDITRLLT